VQTLASTLLTRALAVAHTVVVARWLEPRAVGVLAVVSYVLSVLGALADLGLPAAASRLVAEGRVSRPEALRGWAASLGRLMALLAGLAGLVLATAAGPLARFYGEPALETLFRLAAALLVATLLGALLSGLLQGLRRIGMLALLGPLKALTSLGGTLLLVSGLGVAGVLLAGLGAELLVGALAGAVVLRALPPPTPGARRGGLSPAARGLALGLPIFLHGLLGWGGAWAVRTWVAHARGWAAVGHYQVADALARAVLVIPTALTVPLLPVLTEVSVQPGAGPGRSARQALRFTGMLTLPVAVFVALGGTALTELLYGKAYAPAGPLVTLLAPAATLQALVLVLWALMIATGRLWAGVVAQGTGQALLVLALPALVPTFGLVGLGLAHLVAQGVTLALGGMATRDLLGRHPALAGPGILAVAAWAGVGLLAWTAGPSLLAAAIGSSGALGVAWALLTAPERERVRALLAHPARVLLATRGERA
jgi:O-antigen/teichoic acid export membrane protein